MKRNPFGQRISHLRKLRGWSQRELAEKAGVTQRTITYYELEAHINFVEKIEKIALALEVPIEELFAFSNKKFEYTPFATLNPRVMKKIEKLLRLTATDRTKIYEQIELFLKKDEYNQ